MLREGPPADVVVDTHLVGRMLRAQHPDLAALPLRPLGVGWDNVVFRLGSDLCVRVPRRALGAQLVGIEAQWLPTLASRLPLPVPTPLRVGEPQGDYPWQWTVCRYVPGRALGPAGLRGGAGGRAVADLVAFLRALHRPAPPDAPTNPLRGVPLGQRSDAVARALSVVPLTSVRASTAEQAFAAALAADPYSGPPRWLHGDLHNRNILASRGRISGVIDFGDLSAGDPSTDLAVSWLVLDADARGHLRAELGVPEATWARARGWAVFFALMFVEHSRSAPEHAAIGAATLREIASDAC